ncbi:MULTISPECIES: alpha/beta fold hydrolase [Aeromicrobium]|uniref:Alpha/beta fold hydrolase n=1 Tax=Aeromicrobium yanjiei TaxID=2662028 RepID=A0A5Q2MIG6_9ACTN|nr:MULTISPECIES: alpha/beta fold hydrolase [Aeromicrobium]MRK00198.1 alpha/beta fold hydrolase [Aeromicrobium sp. S22]QGG42904.1 alpha/beta fold hydrolase [Aeromicrobium yanjiei]
MQTVQVNGAELAYTDSGPTDGVPVLLSHSLFFDHSMFDDLRDKLVEAGHRVVAYDHRGQGASSPGTRDELAVDALTDDAAALIRALDLAPVHAVGNSLGGFVALRLAARHPDLLLSAAALGSSAEEEHQLEAFAPLVDLLCEVGGAEHVDTLLHIMFGDTSLAEQTPAVEHWRTSMAALGPSIGDAAWQVIHRGRIVEELADCRVPVLAIAGSEDHAYPPPISDINIAEAAAGSYRTVSAAGHSVALEQPDIVASHLLEHFAAAPVR